MSELWTTIASERGALADDLDGLADDRWQTRSLCTEWTVHDVLAHMASTADMSAGKFFAGFAGSGFSFTKFTEKGIADKRGATPGETVATFRALQHSTKCPPGPKVSWLGETVIHAEDIRRPLGIRHTYDSDAVRQVADFYKGSNTLIGAKNRVAGLRLAATDADWKNGDGPEVRGPLHSLLMAMTGRGIACDDLTGEGVGTLRRRCS